MSELKNVSRDEVSGVLGEFTSAVELQTSLGVGTDEFIRKVLVNALGEEKAASLMERISLGGNRKGLDALKWMDPRAVADLVVARAAHPPQLCIPAGGWIMETIEQRPFQSPSLHQGRPFELTRIVINKDNVRQLVYYWFQGRGRYEDNTYGIKLNIVRDSVLYQRTDGALVRFVTTVAQSPDGLTQADARIQQFKVERHGGAK